MWSYLACALPAALASCSPERHVYFKIVTLVHWSLSGNAAGYLADDWQLVADAHVRQLRSADTRQSETVSYGDRTFAAAEPRFYNSLPPNLKLCGLPVRLVQTVTEDIFIRTVRPRRSAICFLTVLNRSILTYLLTCRTLCNRKYLRQNDYWKQLLLCHLVYSASADLNTYMMILSKTSELQQWVTVHVCLRLCRTSEILRTRPRWCKWL